MLRVQAGLDPLGELDLLLGGEPLPPPDQGEGGTHRVGRALLDRVQLGCRRHVFPLCRHAGAGCCCRRMPEWRMGRETLVSSMCDRCEILRPIPRGSAHNPGRAAPSYSSSSTVRGPTLTLSTSMCAPKTPVATVAPRRRRAATNSSTSGLATGPGAAWVQLGRRPFRVSPYSVN